MKGGRILLVAASVVLVCLAGSSSAGTAAKPKTKPAAPAPKAAASWQTARPVIPEWAPKKPSPEFLRAAQVLKPIPLDMEKVPGATEAENAARVAGAKIMRLAAYELFGTLSDAQIDRFLQAKPSYLVIPIKQLTKAQRAALDRYFAAWRTAWKGRVTADDPASGDCVLMLYKMGATRDLSNILVGFDAGKYQGGGHDVHLCFHFTGAENTCLGSYFAQI